MTKSRLTLLGVGFATEGFGFGRVFRSLYAQLGGRWEIEHLEFSRRRDEVSENCWRVHHTKRPAAFFGHLEFAELVERRRPDLIFFSVDVWQVPAYLRALEGAPGVHRTVAYCPVDGKISGGPELKDLSRLDRLVVPTSFGRNMVRTELDRLGVVDPVQVDVIPHGIDSHRFFPYDDQNGRTGKERARGELFPDRPDLVNDFIVLNANRNQSRKRLDLTLDGFARFSADKPPDVKLYLHSGIIDEGLNLSARARKLGISERCLPSVMTEHHPVVSDEKLNRIYNACDVGVNTSLGEGWGLIAFEHGATRAPQVVPRHSACEELWKEAGVLLPTTPLESADGNWFQGSATSAESLAEALERLYANRAFRDEKGDAAFRNSRREELSWHSVALRFEDLFLEVLEQPRRG